MILLCYVKFLLSTKILFSFALALSLSLPLCVLLNHNNLITMKINEPITLELFKLPLYIVDDVVNY